jgi:Xaa-Pro aminopeptidase
MSAERAELDEKAARVERLLGEAGLAGLIIGAQHNFAWITGGGTIRIDGSREAGAGALLLGRGGRRYVLANVIEMPRIMEEAVGGQGYEPVEFGWEDERSSPSFLVDTARKLLGGSDPIGSDLPAPSAVGAEGRLTRARARLTGAEQARFRVLGRDAGEALGDVCRGLETGMTEMEISRRSADALAARGARAIVNLVAADDRIARYRHPVATERRWERTVMVVACAQRDGLVVSLTRIMSAGPVSDDLRRRTRATAGVMGRLLAATRSGTTGRQLYDEARRAYAEAGFPGEERKHHQGGAGGYRTRDWIAHPASDDVVDAPQAFAWNPSITGTKVEETAIAHGDDDAVEVITSTPGWPAITVDAGGVTVEMPDVWSKED